MKTKRAIRQCQQGWRLLQLFDIVPPVKTWHHTLLRSTLHNRNICRDPRGSSWLTWCWFQWVYLSPTAGPYQNPLARAQTEALPNPHNYILRALPLPLTHHPGYGLCTSTRALPKSLGTKQRWTLRGLTATPPLPVYTKNINTHLMVGSYQAPTSTH